MSDFIDALARVYADPGPLGISLRVLVILILAWLASRILGGFLPRLIFALGPRAWRRSFSSQRLVTLRDLIVSIARVVAYSTALVLILLQFIDPAAILAAVSLFSFAFGLSARPLISDVFAGITLLFEDQFTVGEKVEFSGAMGSQGVMGMVERVGLRTTHIRADSGELFNVPNGDVRLVRNFSRGEFSLASITVSVRLDRVAETIALLRDTGRRAQVELDDIVEEPLVMSETGALAAETALTLKVKTRLGQGVAVRSELLVRAQKELTQKGIHVDTP